MTKLERIFTEAHIPLELFPIEIYYTESTKDFIKMCNHLGVEPITNVGGRTMLLHDKHGNTIILMAVFNKHYSTLAHECTHAGLYIAEAIGHNITNTDELIPYLVGYLFQKASKHYESN